MGRTEGRESDLGWDGVSGDVRESEIGLVCAVSAEFCITRGDGTPVGHSPKGDGIPTLGLKGGTRCSGRNRWVTRGGEGLVELGSVYGPVR